MITQNLSEDNVSLQDKLLCDAHQYLLHNFFTNNKKINTL